MICKNCDTEFAGNFCNNCGQSSKVGRITWNYILNSISESIFQVDKGFLFTIRNLILKPGSSIKDFLKGKRVNYYKPFAFLFVTAAIYVISNRFLGKYTFADEFIRGVLEAISEDWNQVKVNKIMNFLRGNQTYLFLYSVPLYSISLYLFFKNSEYKLSEIFISNMYITGIQLLVYTLFSVLLDQDSQLVLLPLIIAFIYNWWVQNQLFSSYPWLIRNGKLFLSYFVFTLFIISTFTVFIGILINQS